MIRKITINNFKSLKSSGEIALKNVNILTGLNGMGKSSLIQALLLLRQSNELSKGLKLRDGLVNIGTKDDALFTYADKDEIHLGINDFFWVFDASSNTHFLKTIYGQENDWEELKKLAVFNDQFQYISADRVAQIEMHEVPGNLDQKFLGVRGEYTVHFLEAVHTGKIRAEIPPVLRHHLAKEFSDLLLQTNAWLSEISPNTKVVTKQITSEQIQLGFSFGQMQTNPFKPKNVGFGLSYVLSVIVALLTSQKGGLIILENPEAHLHPRGQAKLGELIALAARNGAQIILEIHSDHILNGIRVMNRLYFNDTNDGVPDEKRRGISNEEVGVFWFERNEEEFSTRIIPVKIEPDARIKNAPLGFFDQFDIDLKKILGFSTP